MRKRTYGARARSKSAAAKRQKTLARVPRLGIPSAASRGRYVKAKLAYSTAINIDPGLSTCGVHVFAANGLHDPDITGIGYQPTGFDQYMALYNEYVVTKSYIKVCAVNTDPNSQQMVGIAVLDLPTTSSDPRVYLNSGTCKWGVVDVYKSGSTLSLTHEVDIRSMSTQDIFNENSYAGTVSTNPPDTHHWHVFVAPTDFLSNTAAVACIVYIEYEVYFRDPALTSNS